MHKPESLQENETHKILLDSDIQTDLLIPVRRPHLVLINKKKRTCHLKDFPVPANHRMKIKESEKTNKYLDLCRKLNKKIKK